MTLRRHSLAGLTPPNGGKGTSALRGGNFSTWNEPIDDALAYPNLGSFKDGYAYYDGTMSGLEGFSIFSIETPYLDGGERRVITTGFTTDANGRVNVTSGFYPDETWATLMVGSIQISAGVHTSDPLPESSEGPYNFVIFGGEEIEQVSTLIPLLAPNKDYWIALEVLQDGPKASLFDEDPGSNVAGTPIATLSSPGGAEYEEFVYAERGYVTIIDAAPVPTKGSQKSLRWYPDGKRPDSPPTPMPNGGEFAIWSPSTLSYHADPDSEPFVSEEGELRDADPTSTDMAINGPTDTTNIGVDRVVIVKAKTRDDGKLNVRLMGLARSPDQSVGTYQAGFYESELQMGWTSFTGDVNASNDNVVFRSNDMTFTPNTFYWLVLSIKADGIRGSMYPEDPGPDLTGSTPLFTHFVSSASTDPVEANPGERYAELYALPFATRLDLYHLVPDTGTGVYGLWWYPGFPNWPS